MKINTICGMVLAYRGAAFMPLQSDFTYMGERIL